jgi:hypothetical protein
LPLTFGLLDELMRVFPAQLIIGKLKGSMPQLPRLECLRQMTADECFAKLRTLSGRDFGDDLAAWEQWWEEEKKRRDIDSEF